MAIKLVDLLKEVEEGSRLKQFLADFNDTISYAHASIKDGFVIIYLDNDPNKEINLIRKLVRTKYSDLLKKVYSEDDMMKYKILK